MKRFFIPSVCSVIAIVHFLTYSALVVHAVAVDALSDTLPASQSLAISVLGMPLMPLARVFAGGIFAAVALAIANSSLWAVGLTGAFIIWRRWRLRRSHQTPNQPLQPTPMSVTDRADARSAPATVVADL